MYYLDLKSMHWLNLRNKFDFWNVRGIMNSSGLLQSDSMNRPKIEFIAYNYILL